MDVEDKDSTDQLQVNNETNNGRSKPTMQKEPKDLERDEHVEARKKSDSVSKARPPSIASLGSVRHDSISNNKAGVDTIAEGGHESQSAQAVYPQVAGESSSTHSRFSRNKRKPSPTASDGKSELESSTRSSPPNSVLSYSGEFNPPSAQEQITLSVESVSAINKRLFALEETNYELMEEVRKRKEREQTTCLVDSISDLKRKVSELEEEMGRKSDELHELNQKVLMLSEELNQRKSEVKTKCYQDSTGSLKVIPEQDNTQVEVCGNRDDSTDSINPTSYGGCNDTDTDSSNFESKVEINCEAQTSTNNVNSPPFFSDHGDAGYQMCITLERNNHDDPELKFSFVIMKSKMDKKLPWPFGREVRVAVVHKVDRSKDNVIMIRPKSEKSFQCPKSDLNEPFMFLQEHHSSLFNGGFITGNKITFNITVT